MCGIFCCLSRSKEVNYSLYEKCSNWLSARGPDASSKVLRKLKNHYLLLAGHTLWTQGACPIPQPVSDSSGQLLLWNGDVFGGLTFPKEKCDSVVLLSLLSSSNVTDVLSRIHGPYAMVYFADALWFARDPIGRHSLLWSLEENGLLLSSVSPSPTGGLKELPAFGIYKATISISGNYDITLFPWSHLDTDFDVTQIPGITIGPSVHHHTLSGLKNMFTKIPNPDPSNLDYFQEFTSGIKSADIFNSLLNKYPVLLELAAKVESMLNEAVKVRMEIPPYCKLCLPLRESCNHSRIAVLFSGGIDSTLLAHLASQHVNDDETIDLWNVAFDRTGSFDTPDRKSALAALEELKNLAPNISWNFVQVNVSREELDLELERRIRFLVCPLFTVLDADLGAALWFASTGKMLLNGEIYSSPARVVLVGMGADEQCGGYRKARSAWERGSWEALSSELWAGIRDLPTRNLGRDNRVLSDHGLAPRLPFLHEPLVALLASVPPWHKWCPANGGDKLILRLVAWKCGLRGCASFPKRAMQFGSRIAVSKQVASDIAPCFKKYLESI